MSTSSSSSLSEVDNSKFFVDKEEIKVTLTLKRNIAFVGRLISYQQNKTFDEFVSEEIRQAILATGPDHLNSNQSLKEYAKQFLDQNGEEI
jgi:hypothetical protein